MKTTKEIQEEIQKRVSLLDNHEVERLAKDLCQTRCGMFDRDPHCQKNGRCGDNWKLFTSHVVALITGPLV